MPCEPASSTLLAALRLTAHDLAPGRLDDETDAAERWLAARVEPGRDEVHTRLRAGVEAVAAALRLSPPPLLFIICLAPGGLPAFRMIPVAGTRAIRVSTAFLAQGACRHDVLALDGRPEPRPCVALPLDPREVSRRRRPLLGELRHYVASQLVPRLGDVRQLPGASDANSR